MTVAYPPQLTVHRRSDWEDPTWAMATGFDRPPPAISLSSIDRVAVHYTAAGDVPDGDPGETWHDVARWLRNAQQDYIRNRRAGTGYVRRADGVRYPGYSLGYSYWIDWLGGVWEVRGVDYQQAATSGHNGHTVAILMLVDGDDHGNDLMWESFRTLSRWIKSLGAPLVDDPWAHGWFVERTGTGTATSCCGTGLKADLMAGLGRMSYQPPTPPPGDITMGMNVTRLRFAGYQEQLVCFRCSADTLRTLGLLDEPLIVLPNPNATQKAEIEAGLGAPLTPIQGD